TEARALFGGMTMQRSLWAVGLALTLTGGGQADEEAAVKAIEKLGYRVSRDEQAPGRPVTGVVLIGPRVSDATLKVLKDLQCLQVLDLNDSLVTDAGLKELKDLQQLRELYLRSTFVTDAGLKELKGLCRLQALGLGGTKVTDAGLKNLKDFKQLKHLDL